MHGRIVREALDFEQMDVVPSDDISVDERVGKILADAQEPGVLDINRGGFVAYRDTPLLPGSYTLRAVSRGIIERFMRILDKESELIVVRSDVIWPIYLQIFTVFSAMKSCSNSLRINVKLWMGLNRYEILRDKGEIVHCRLSVEVRCQACIGKQNAADGFYDELVLKPFKKSSRQVRLPDSLIKEQVL